MLGSPQAGARAHFETAQIYLMVETNLLSMTTLSPSATRAVFAITAIAVAAIFGLNAVLPSVSVSGRAATEGATEADSALPAWVNLTKGLAPNFILQTALAYDPNIGAVVTTTIALPANRSEAGETWYFQDNTWTRPALAIEPAVTYPLLAYDQASGDLVLFNSEILFTSHPSSSTWIFANGTWTNVTAQSGLQPPPRVYSQMTWDSATQSVVLFGGSGNSSTVQLEDTWEYSDGTWRNVTSLSDPSNTPPCSIQGGFADDPPLGGALYVGGQNWNGTCEAATYLFGAHGWSEFNGLPGSIPRAGPGFTFDSTDSEAVLVGGSCCVNGPGYNDTWGLSSVPGWTRILTQGYPQSNFDGFTSGISGAGMAFDPLDNELVLAGGNGVHGYSNATWGLVLPANTPPEGLSWEPFAFAGVVVVALVLIVLAAESIRRREENARRIKR